MGEIAPMLTKFEEPLVTREVKGEWFAIMNSRKSQWE
jgi:hypothetical protein